MLTTLRVANRVRVSTLVLTMCRPPVIRTSLEPSTQSVQLQKFCSDKSSRSKTQICPPGGKTQESKKTESKKKDEEECEDGEKESKPLDCCKPGDTEGEKKAKEGKGVCHESQTKFKKAERKEEAEAKEEESCEETESESSESAESSESEDEKAPVKECHEDEKMDDPGEDKRGKSVSEMCDCVKAAVAKFEQEKGKGQQKGVPPPKSVDKGKKDDTKPKVSEHVGCCNVERSSSSSSGEPSGVDRCKSYRQAERNKGQADEDCQVKEKDDGKEGKKDPVQEQCKCIKQALDTCKSGKTTEKKEVEKKKSGEGTEKKKKTCEKKDDKKKAEKKPKKEPEEKPEKKLEEKKTDDKKTSKKDCYNKKKKPVVKCR